MFNYIKGKVAVVTGSYVVIENNNVGFQIKVANPFNFEIDSEITIYTYMHVREDAIELFGFETNEEKQFFLQLISVKGLGPKSALAIIANGNIARTIEAINNADNRYLQKFPGIGAKASQQIILDLHGKLNFQAEIKKSNPKIDDIKEALKSMGYKADEIKSVVPLLEANINEPVQVLIKLALKHFIK